MIYSWYKSINTAIGREEYVPFFADAATTLHIGVAHVRNGVEKYTRKSVTLGGRTGMLAFGCLRRRLHRFPGFLPMPYSIMT